MSWLPKTYYNVIKKFWQDVRGVEEKPVRARTEEGKFVADDKSTPDVNEAYVGGKAPKKKAIKITRKKFKKR